MTTKAETKSISTTNAFAFDGARKGWKRMISEGLTAVLARAA